MQVQLTYIKAAQTTCVGDMVKLQQMHCIRQSTHWDSRSHLGGVSEALPIGILPHACQQCTHCCLYQTQSQFKTSQCM